MKNKGHEEVDCDTISARPRLMRQPQPTDGQHSWHHGEAGGCGLYLHGSDVAVLSQRPRLLWSTTLFKEH